MHIGDREQSECLGQAQMQRAEIFWAAFDRAIHRICFAYVLEARYKLLKRIESERSLPNIRMLTVLQDRVDAAHDLRQHEIINMHAMSETARAAEMMARIRYEEGEDRMRDNSQGWEPGG